MIKMFDPCIGEEETKAAQDVLSSRFWASGEGTGKVRDFEKMLNQFIGSQACIAVSNGTAALHLALSLSGSSGRSVLVPSLTFVSTVNAVLMNGGKPVFVDVDPETLCMDVEDARGKIDSNASAIVPVHFGGIPCDLEAITGLAEEHHLHTVEDAAHACGSLYKGKVIGSQTEACCFSFHPTKNLATPSGGAITVNGPEAPEREKLLISTRWCGIADKRGPLYDVTRLGWNYYMNEISAAIGLVQLSKLREMNAKRLKVSRYYNSHLNVEHKMPYVEGCSYGHLYWIRVKDRERFMQRMAAQGIQTGIHYRPVHLMSLYKGQASLPNTERIWPELVTLPMHANLADDDLSYIVESVNKLLP